MEEYSQNLTIKSWAEADRPREKLLEKGRSALTDAELIAILIASGSRNETAVELSKRILQSVTNSLDDLGKLSVKDLTKFKGIGEAKAITIVAALELGRRRKEGAQTERKKVTTSKDVYDHFKAALSDLPHEEFWILMLNRANKIIGSYRISQGGVAGTVADTKIIFQKAIEALASSIILCHNHPSGNLKPSDADVTLTKKLKEAGGVMDIPVLDHLIFTDAGFYSFADEGMM